MGFCPLPQWNDNVWVVVENTSHASTLMVSGWVYLGVVTDQKGLHAKVGVESRCEVSGLKCQKIVQMTLIRRGAINKLCRLESVTEGFQPFSKS